MLASIATAADRIVTLERRVAELEAALRHQRSLTAYERQRAASADERSAVAWRVVTTGAARRVEEPKNPPVPVLNLPLNRTLVYRP